MPANLHAATTTIIIVAVFAFFIYRRIRRSIGRQRLQPGRLMARIGIVILASVLILTARIADMNIFAAAGIGLILGVGLGFYALKHTRFEIVDGTTFYTGHPYIGLGVAMLVVGRLIYRFTQISGQVAGQGLSQGPGQGLGPMSGMSPGQGLAASFGNPLTAGTFFVMVGYYVVYYGGLLRNRPHSAPVDPGNPGQ